MTERMMHMVNSLTSKIYPQREDMHKDTRLEKMLLLFADMSKTHAVASGAEELEKYFAREDQWGTAFDWVQFHSGHVFNHSVPPKYAKADVKIDERTNAFLDEAIAVCKRHGKKVCYMVGDYAPIDCFLKAYPEMKDLYTGKFWEFIYDMICALFKRFPDIDEYGTYLFESRNVIHCDSFFRAFNYGVDMSDEVLENNGAVIGALDGHAYPYLSFGEHIRMMLIAMAQACKDNGKSFVLLTHAWYPYQEELLYEALKDFPHDLPILLEHNYTTGDFNPSLPQPKLISMLPHMNHGLVFCCGMEYHGLGLVPCCFPEQMQERINDALDATPNLKRITMRPIWDGHTALDTPNEVNVYSLMKMADHPDVCSEDLWHEWIEMKYGIADADKRDILASALRSGYKVVDKVNFEFGIRTNDHSHIPSYAYVDSRTHNYGKALIQWCPTPENKQTIYDLLIRPNAKILRMHREIHEEALEQIEKAIKKIESIRDALREEDYHDLVQRFDVQRIWVMLHHDEYEAYIRLLMERRTPDKENRQKAEAALERLADTQDRIARGELRQSYLYAPGRIDDFIANCRRELALAAHA